MQATVDSTLAGAGGPDNYLYVTVTVCVPGTQTCGPVDHVQVSTATSGLRILASALPPGVTLTPEPDPNAAANTLAECYQLPQGTAWGQLALADVKIGGETAANVPIQLLSNTINMPATNLCADNGPVGTVQKLMANGVLGIGPLPYDCTGTGCTSQYFTCIVDANDNNATACSANVSKAPGTSAQVTNPVTKFAVDKNGVIIKLPLVDPNSGAKSGITGSIIFGIGTQADNAYSGSVTAYAADPTSGALTTSYSSVTAPAGSSGVNYTSWFDTGSDAFFFPDTGIMVCSDLQTFYCPGQPLPLSAKVTGAGSPGVGGPTTVGFTVVSADVLNETPSAAFSSLAANSPMPNTDFLGYSGGKVFVWGLPFFFNRTVFIAYPSASIAGNGGVTLKGPFYAF